MNKGSTRAQQQKLTKSAVILCEIERGGDLSWTWYLKMKEERTRKRAFKGLEISHIDINQKAVQ